MMKFGMNKYIPEITIESLCQCNYLSMQWIVKRVPMISNTLRPRQDGRYFADDVSKCIFLNENVWISLKIPFEFVPKGPINNIPALVQIMAWRRPGDKPLSEPMLIFVPTHICVTRPQWVNSSRDVASERPGGAAPPGNLPTPPRNFVHDTFLGKFKHPTNSLAT